MIGFVVKFSGKRKGVAHDNHPFCKSMKRSPAVLNQPGTYNIGSYRKRFRTLVKKERGGLCQTAPPSLTFFSGCAHHNHLNNILSCFDMVSNFSMRIAIIYNYQKGETIKTTTALNQELVLLFARFNYYIMKGGRTKKCRSFLVFSNSFSSFSIRNSFRALLLCSSSSCLRSLVTSLSGTSR